MKKDIAEKWIAALESGEYKQGKEVLCENGMYCCLGVLCELAVKDNITRRDEGVSPDSVVAYESCTMGLPFSVMEWAGMKTTEGEVDIDLRHRGYYGRGLSSFNDTGMPFKEIAQVIREKVDAL